MSQAYNACAKYMQHKLPLQSVVLQSLSAVDPIARGHSQTAVHLKKLLGMTSHLLPGDADGEREVLQYNVDQALPKFEEGGDVVQWWAAVFKKEKYPALSQAVKAALSVFHGALVESSFSAMGNIIDPKATSMKISTFSAVQTVKYTLQNRKQTGVEMFKRDDLKFGEIDRRLCANISGAGTRDKAQRRANLAALREKRAEFECQPSTSAAAKRAEVVEKERMARKRHMAAQRKCALERLVKAKKSKK